MTIACLGWGSLIWDPRNLPIGREWFKDGPFVPVEFTRQSNDGRVTLVIDQNAAPVRVLWAQMLLPDLQAARAALRDRENLTACNWSSLIGSWQKGGAAPATIPELPAWADANGLDAVIWTALGPRFDGKGTRPSVDEVINYLRGLTGTQRDHAERYIRCAPRQIDTQYRRRVEAEFGWSFW